MKKGIGSLILLVLLCLAAQAPASAATTERVSVASDGTQANAGSDLCEDICPPGAISCGFHIVLGDSQGAESTPTT